MAQTFGVVLMVLVFVIAVLFSGPRRAVLVPPDPLRLFYLRLRWEASRRSVRRRLGKLRRRRTRDVVPAPLPKVYPPQPWPEPPIKHRVARSSSK